MRRRRGFRGPIRDLIGCDHLSKRVGRLRAVHLGANESHAVAAGFDRLHCTEEIDAAFSASQTRESVSPA